MSNITKQPGEHRKGAEIDSLLEDSRLPVLRMAVDNTVYAALSTRPDIASAVIQGHERSQTSQEPYMQAREVVPAAASMALDATVTTEPAPTEPSMLGEDPTADPVATEAYWRSLEQGMGAQVDEAYNEAGVSSLEEARAEVNAVFDRLTGDGQAPYASPED